MAKLVVNVNVLAVVFRESLFEDVHLHGVDSKPRFESEASDDFEHRVEKEADLKKQPIYFI